MPASHPGLKSLSAAHLEARVVHAAKLHDNWYSSHPRPRQAVEFLVKCPSDDEQTASPISQVLFMPGRSGEFLLVLRGKGLSCWEVPLDGSGAYEIASFHHEGVEIEQVIMNQDVNNGLGEFAFWSRCADRCVVRLQQLLVLMIGAVIVRSCISRLWTLFMGASWHSSPAVCSRTSLHRCACFTATSLSPAIILSCGTGQNPRRDRTSSRFMGTRWWRYMSCYSPRIYLLTTPAGI